MTSISENATRNPGPARNIEKIPTGIRGMDEVLRGGIPKGALTLIGGGPGSGKTILGLEFLVRGALAGNPGVLLTFEEREPDLRRYAGAFGWDLSALEKDNRLTLISARIPSEAICSGHFDLRGVLAILRQKTEEIQADRVLIDAPDVFLRLLDNIGKEQAELHMMNEWIRDAGLTALMTVKSGSHGGAYASQYEFLEYMSDCAIHLDHRVQEQVTTRRLRVIKYRGSGFGHNEYPFGITEQGVWIIPVTQASLQHRALGESMPSGIDALDGILDGGYRRSSCALVTGSSGTGKTTLVCSFAAAAVSRNERVLYLNFEESWDALTSCMASPGIDMSAARKSGNLRFISAMPESQGIEDHLIQAFKAIEAFQPDHLIVDAISACRRMGSQHSSFDYLLRLINYCKVRGITTLLTNLATTDAENEITGIDLSSVIDTVIVVRNREKAGRYVREMGILKSRGRGHSSRIHEFQITTEGIRITGKEAVHA
jgi:circadian clock protein KaiC